MGDGRVGVVGVVGVVGRKEGRGGWKKGDSQGTSI